MSFELAELEVEEETSEAYDAGWCWANSANVEQLRALAGTINNHKLDLCCELTSATDFIEYLSICVGMANSVAVELVEYTESFGLCGFGETNIANWEIYSEAVRDFLRGALDRKIELGV